MSNQFVQEPNQNMLWKIVNSTAQLSEFFRVLNSDPFYPQTLAAYSVPSKNRADRPFEIQPRISAYDAFGILFYTTL